MNLNPKLAISVCDKEILTSLLKKYLPNTPVWVYGSRLTDAVRPWSDLDMVVFTKIDQQYPLSLLKEAFEESNLSFRVDLQEWNLLPDSFKTNIEKSHAKIQ